MPPVQGPRHVAKQATRLLHHRGLCTILQVVTQLHALLQGTKGGSESLSLQEQFQMCSENVKHVTNITDEQKLGLYGLYKQVWAVG